jgi:type II secretory pathway component PulF
MGNFSYRAVDAQGSRTEGRIEAPNLDRAKQLLQQRHLMVISVTKGRVLEETFNPFERRRINGTELEYLTSELALLLNSGVTIDRGLAVIKRNTSSGPQDALVGNLYGAVRRGENLSTAMSDEDGVFNPLYVNLVELGESSATLPQVFLRLAEDIKFQNQLKSKILQALTYPLVIFFVCILCIAFIFNYIVPQMSGLFQGLPEIPTYTAALLAMSEWMIAYQWYLLMVVLGFCVIILSFLRTSSGARRIDELLMATPGLKQVLILVERIRFNTAIAMMLGSGILIDRCIEMSVGSIRNQSLRQELTVARDRIKKGESLSAALSVSPLYPDFSISLIEVGEESGQLEPVFNELSVRARREFEGWVDRFTALLEPLLILFMGVVVGGVVVTMLLSIVSINDIGF